MFEIPLHPVAVHFPIVLGLLIPIASLSVFILIKLKYLDPRIWLLVVILSGLFFASAVVAVQTGEKDEHKVEEVVGHKVLETHEEHGEKIQWLALAVFLISITPLLLKKPTELQILTVIISSIVVYPLIETGHTGGELIYKHGAAEAHMIEEIEEDCSEQLEPGGSCSKILEDSSNQNLDDHL
ncbi:MAG: hypothetical protein KDD58_11000 [Bdellovibrionales bacterium]|nr:hypothetical protein [Bdellovibrionales bacterium]